jgi:hypothetical protein
VTCYCTLHINSSDHAILPKDLFPSSAAKKFRFTDQQSPERKASRQRLRMQGLALSEDRARYWWHLNTDGRVMGDDIHVHISWLVGQLAKGQRLAALKAQGYHCWFSMFWGGNGSGGGPLITHEAMALLTLHEAELGVGFYYEEAP